MMSTKQKTVLLIQPRDPSGKFPWLPNILAVAARLMTHDIHCIVKDLNIDDELLDTDLEAADWIGIGMLGAPYIPVALDQAKSIRDKGFSQHIFLGGPIAGNIVEEEWAQILELTNLTDLFVMRSETELAMSLGIPNLKSIYEVSMADAIEALPEYMLKIYFQRDFCIFTSNGCIFDCSFCGAERNTPEKFRNLDVFRNEMECIARLVKKYGGAQLTSTAYLSTLDCLQNPDQMKPMLKIIANAFAEQGISIPLRCLATSKMTYKALGKDANILKRWKTDYRLESIGIGIDGGSNPTTWKRLHKTHNNYNEISIVMDAIKSAGIIAEALMVIGFPQETFRETLNIIGSSLHWTIKGMQVRPYEGKDNAPKVDKYGNSDWDITPFLPNYELLSHLDYGMFGSPVTHPNTLQRWRANIAFAAIIVLLKIFNPYGCPTHPLLPTKQGNIVWRNFAAWWNSHLPGDK